MELGLERRSNERRIHSASCKSDFLLDVSHSAEGQNVISLSKWEDSGSQKLILSGPVCEWEKAGGEAFGSCAVLDVRKGLVFASLKDRRRLVSFQASKERRFVLDGDEVKELKFKSPLFDLAALAGASCEKDGDVIAAISAGGELELFCATRSDRDVKRRIIDPVPLESVLAVSCFRDDHLLVVGMQKSKILVCALRFSTDSDFDFLVVDRYPPLQLPQPPASAVSSRALGDSFVLGVVFTESYGFILYSGGFVHVLTPLCFISEKHEGNLKAWYQRNKHIVQTDPLVISRPAYAFRLSPGSVEDNSVSISDKWKGIKEDAGDIARLGESYVAIGYGQYVSVWDGTYRVGHALAQISGRVTAICSRLNSSRVLIGSEKGFEELRIKNDSPLSLGLAIKRRGTCDAIVTSMQQTLDTGPIRSQPVIVSATKVAAEVEGDTEPIFHPLMKSLDEEEMKLVRALLCKNSTGSPGAVARLTEQYTTEPKKRTVRRGNFGRSADLGLSKLPSERLAAVSVARCLYEIHFGGSHYVVPLIDMLGTGVVSSEAVLSVVGMSDSWNMGPESEPLDLRSVVDPLTTSPIYLNALEAVVGRIADLPEADIVRVVQYVVRLTQGNSWKDGIATTASLEPKSAALESVQLSQANRLFMKCVTAAADKKRVIESLRQIPFADVVAVLGQFDHVLKAASTPNEMTKITNLPRAPISVQRGLFDSNWERSFDGNGVAMYRGVGNWLDDDGVSERENRDRSCVRGCIEWACHVIDAHLTTLVMDNTGRDLAISLLETVRQRKREFEVLKGLEGLTSHLVGRRPVPSRHDPLFRSTVVEVPTYAALK